MKFAADRPFADPEKAARKLIEIANATAAVQEGRTHRTTQPGFLRADGSVDEYRAGLERAISNGWVIPHESGVYVKFTQAGADLFA
jgi:hypothetical protein